MSAFRSSMAGSVVVVAVAVSLALFAPCSAAEDVEKRVLGRLFTTPQERQNLEVLRHQPPAPVVQEPVPTSVPEAEPAPLNNITVNGIVVREDGKSTVWVNGVNSYDGDLTAQQVRVRASAIQPSAVELDLTDHRGTVKVKPGQTLTPVEPAATQGYGARDKAAGTGDTRRQP